MENTTSILQLHDDCLYIVFGKLSSSVDRESFGLTCRRWLEIQNSCRRSLQFESSFTHRHPASLSRTPIDINALHLNRLIIRFSQLQSLSLSGCTQFPDSGLSVFLTCGLKLQSLCLDCCFGIADTGLSCVARGCPSLKIISLYMCSITDVGLKSLSEFCSSLEAVNLMYCSRITDKGISFLSRNCHQLKAVNVSRCKNVNGTGFQGCSHTLAYLEAESCKLELEGVSSIVSGGGLEYLNIACLHWSRRGHGLASVDARRISQLRTIDFRMCRTIGDDVIVKIAEACPLLREWNLALCHEIRVVGWESFGLNCHNLERLHVNRCRNLCDQGLQALRDGCRRLCTLHLGRCPRISSEAIEMFKFARSSVEMTDEEVMCIGPAWAFSSYE